MLTFLGGAVARTIACAWVNRDVVRKEEEGCTRVEEVVVQTDSRERYERRSRNHSTILNSICPQPVGKANPQEIG